MRKTFTYSMLLVLAAVLLLGSGCGKLRRNQKDKDMMADGAVIGGVTAVDLDGAGLGDDRFMDGQPYGAGQFAPVLFAYDSSQVEGPERAKLDPVAAEMQRNAGLSLIVEGHCDERGSREYNLALGEHRALAVRAYLVGLGIEGDRVTTRSYGEENPAEFGHDEESWARNRRAEFMLMQ